MAFFDILKLLMMTVIASVGEWLPVSNTGHLAVFGHYLGFSDWNASAAVRESFAGAAVFGTVLASCALFLPNNGAFTKTQDNRRAVARDRIRFYVAILLAWIPTLAVQLMFGRKLNEFLMATDSLQNLKLVMVLMIAGGAVVWLSEIRNKNVPVRYELPEDIPVAMILLFGLIPLLSFLPGTCRFGLTILAAVSLGVSRRTALTLAVFFNMPAAIVFGAVPVIRRLFSVGGIAVSELLTASVLSFLISFFVLKAVLTLLGRNRMSRFGQYRVGFGILLYLFSIL